MSSSSMSGSIYANFILLAVVEGELFSLYYFGLCLLKPIIVPGYSFGSKIADMFGRRKAGVLFFFISGNRETFVKKKNTFFWGGLSL